MKITSQEEYGLRCLLRLARAGSGRSLTIPEIAANEGLSVPYVAKLLSVLRQAGLIDSVLAGDGAGATGGRKNGYLYTITLGTGAKYTATAAAEGGQGARSFFVDETGVIRYKEGNVPPDAETGTPINGS